MKKSLRSLALVCFVLGVGALFHGCGKDDKSGKGSVSMTVKKVS